MIKLMLGDVVQRGSRFMAAIRWFPSRRRNAPAAHTYTDPSSAGQTGHAIAKLAVSPILLLTWTAREGVTLR